MPTASLRTAGCYLIRYLHLDTYFVDLAHEMYQYSLRKVPWRLIIYHCKSESSGITNISVFVGVYVK